MQRSKLSFVQQSPVLLCAFAFMAGILSAHASWRPAGWLFWSALLASVFAAVLCARRKNWAVAGALTAALAAGSLDAHLERLSRHGEPSLAPFCDGLLYTFTGTVERAGLIHPVQNGLLQSVDFAVEAVDRYGNVQHPASKLRANVMLDEQQAPLRYGMRVRFDAQLHRAQMFRDPGVWNRREWLAQQGITALASVKRGSIEVLGTEGGTRLERARDRLRRSLLEHFHSFADPRSAGWMLGGDDVALLEAMMLGERSELEQADRLDFQRTGSFHLLVVSGMNIAILASFLFWAFRHLPFGDAVASCLTAVFAVIYALLTDLGAPVTRAVIMALVLLLARCFYRQHTSANALGIGALAILAFKPSALFEASFQMTFLSVLALAAIVSPLLGRTTQLYARGLDGLGTLNADFAFEPRVVQFRIELRMIIRRLQRIVGAPQLSSALVRWPLRGALAAGSLLLLSFLMQCVLALPTALYFHRVTTTAILANSVVVPLMEALMPIVLLTLGLSYVSAWAARLPAIGAALALHGITRTIGWLGAARFADVRVPDPTPANIAACTVAFFLAWIACRLQKPRLLIPAVALLAAAALALGLPQRVPPSPNLEVTAIDVGQGDSIFVASPQGNTLLIDSGGPTGGMETSSVRPGFDYGENVVSPYLWSRHISRLDAVAITHGHSDHMQGMPSVIRNFRPGQVWLGLMPMSPLFAEVVAAAREVGAEIRPLRQGDALPFGSVDILVLAPARDAIPGALAKNDDSLSLYLRYGASAALLSGDAEHAEEAAIAGSQPHAQLLKIDHHGSATSTGPDFLNTVSPQFAVISVGEQNHFGHPRREILARLQEAHVRTFRTDTLGAVTFLLSRDGATKVKESSWE